MRVKPTAWGAEDAGELQPYYPKWLLFPNPRAQVSKTKTMGKTVFKHKALQSAKCWAEPTPWLWARSSGDLGTDPALLAPRGPGSASFPGPVGDTGVSTPWGRNHSFRGTSLSGYSHSRHTRLARPLGFSSCPQLPKSLSLVSCPEGTGESPPTQDLCRNAARPRHPAFAAALELCVSQIPPPPAPFLFCPCY